MDEVLEVLDKPKDDPDWWRCRNAVGNTGLVPRNYVRPITQSSAPSDAQSVPHAQSLSAHAATNNNNNHVESFDEVRMKFASGSITSNAFVDKPWWWGTISRSDCETMLSNLATPGEFIIRDSESHVSLLVVSLIYEYRRWLVKSHNKPITNLILFYLFSP